MRGKIRKMSPTLIGRCDHDHMTQLFSGTEADSRRVRVIPTLAHLIRFPTTQRLAIIIIQDKHFHRANFTS